MTKSFSKIFEQFTKLNKIYCGKIIKATVVSIDKNYVVLDSELKSESNIPIEEFINDNNLEIKIGDKIDVFLDSIENGNGKTVLSRKKAKIYKSWINLEKIHRSDSSIIGKIIEKVKGGFIALIEDIRAFLPGSLIDFRSMNSDLEGKELELKIIKIDKKNNNIVISRKAVIELENLHNKEEFLNNLEENNIVKGIVKNITDYGAFIDLGFIDGLLHITDITWRRIKHPSEIVNLGEEIDVKVLQFDKKLNKVSLGLKQLTEDPWGKIFNKYPKNSKVKGKVTNLTDYGFFVEIENGIEGLVHVSEIDWKYKNIHPTKIVKKDDEIEVMILDINIDKRRISLGLKQCKENPWKILSDKYKLGDKITGKIKSVTEFGIFVELNYGIDGLIHLSDISWSIDSKIDLNKYIKGNEILSKILQIDILKSRVSLGLKQLTNDPFDEYILKNKKGSIVSGIINKIFNDNVTINLTENVLGHCILNKKEKNINNLSENNKFKFEIINYDKKLRIIYLNIVDEIFIKNEIISYNEKSYKEITNIMTEAFKEAKNK